MGGEFGTTKRGEADVQIASDAYALDATGAALIERFGFDLRTADPVEFDEHAKSAASQLATALSRQRASVDALHRTIGDRKQAGGSWGRATRRRWGPRTNR